MKYLKEIKKEFKKIYAACLYGSREAGYASKNSDIDIIIILKKFKPKIKYIYKKNFSFLVVEKKFFEQDIYNIKHGDFIAARIGNPIKPILNKEYINKMEIELKKRIVMYSIKKIIYKYKKYANLLEINILYFPFKYWNKLVQIYPPFRYSIENTLKSRLREKNLKKILSGYIKAIEQLKILQEIYPGWYKIKKNFIKNLRKKPSKELIKIYEKEIKKAIERYKTHKKAGADSETDTVIYEISHKIERELKQIKRKGLKKILDNPDKYINLVPLIK